MGKTVFYEAVKLKDLKEPVSRRAIIEMLAGDVAEKIADFLTKSAKNISYSIFTEKDCLVVQVQGEDH
jgi:hypothetical protein